MNNNQNVSNCLPCHTFVMCGTCPYLERCKYIHDPRIKYNKTHIFIKKRNNPTNYSDIWFWPYDTSNDISGIKYYNIPKTSKEYDDIYTIWNNFIDVCNDKNYNLDKTNKIRLPVFKKISS